jgi:oligoendopeptidase F
MGAHTSFLFSLLCLQIRYGLAAATAIKEMIVREGAPAVARYQEFLKSGSSDYPINLLQKPALTLPPQPVNSALQFFGHLLDELEELV